MITYKLVNLKNNIGLFVVSLLFVADVLLTSTPALAEPKYSEKDVQIIADTIFGVEPNVTPLQIFRWNSDVRISLVADESVGRERLNAVRSYVLSVGAESGVDTKFEDSRNANYFIVISDDIFTDAVSKYRDFIQSIVLPTTSVTNLINEYKQQPSACFSHVGVSRNFIVFGAITFIDASISDDRFATCVGSMTFDAINNLSGPQKYTTNVYSKNDGRIIITEMGKKISNIYYDPGLKGGVTKKEFIDYLAE